LLSPLAASCAYHEQPWSRHTTDKTTVRICPGLAGSTTAGTKMPVLGNWRSRHISVTLSAKADESELVGLQAAVKAYPNPTHAGNIYDQR